MFQNLIHLIISFFAVLIFHSTAFAQNISFIELSPFVKINAEVNRVFQEMEKEEIIFDNGYYSAYVIQSDQSLVDPSQRLTKKSEIINYMKKSLFTVFAYAELSEMEKQKAAINLYDRLEKISSYENLEYYTSKKSIMSDSVIELEASCNVGGPDESLFITVRGDKTKVMRVMSDVCD
ncbi:MAG: hypothetical protein HRT44_05850 [Bdellovibrionales bacterium]|nr:hypothetical protein [Bdellovibrionales bacterium]NQZ18768.1 hypothetical protein [Bdellovibrionales bacterium]